MSLAAAVLAGTNRVLLEPFLWRLPLATQRRLLELGTRGCRSRAAPRSIASSSASGLPTG